MKNDEIKYRAIVNRLLDFVYLDVGDDPIKTEQYLAEEGYSYEELANEGIKFVGELARRKRIELAREKKKRLLEALTSFSKGVSRETKEMLFKKLRDVAAGDVELQLAFHKLESLSEDDLRAIVNDVEALKMLSRKNKEEQTPDDESAI